MNIWEIIIFVIIFILMHIIFGIDINIAMISTIIAAVIFKISEYNELIGFSTKSNAIYDPKTVIQNGFNLESLEPANFLQTNDIKCGPDDDDDENQREIEYQLDLTQAKNTINYNNDPLEKTEKSNKAKEWSSAISDNAVVLFNELGCEADSKICNRMRYGGTQAQESIINRAKLNAHKCKGYFEEEFREQEAKHWWGNRDDFDSEL